MFCINFISYSLLEFSVRIKAAIKLNLLLSEILNVVIKFYLSFFLSFSLFSLFDPFHLLDVSVELIFALHHTQTHHTD